MHFANAWLMEQYLEASAAIDARCPPMGIVLARTDPGTAPSTVGVRRTDWDEGASPSAGGRPPAPQPRR
jgi:hypothetical protein